MLDDSGVHAIVEVHLAVHEAVLEVNVGCPRRQGVGDPGQGKIVGRNESDGTGVDQAADHRLGADGAVV